jgi:hypothetical protein
MADIRHVNSAGCNVRRDENPHLPALKSVKRTEALRKRSISVDDRNAVTGLLQCLTESIDPALGPSKHEDRSPLNPQQRHQ